jgi:hypothetical protein
MPIEKNKVKTTKQFNQFKKRVSSSKNGIWFDLLPDQKKFQLFLSWRTQLHLKGCKTTLSLRKFIFSKRKLRFYRVPPQLLRDYSLTKILN